jgi:hypothetical protein
MKNSNFSIWLALSYEIVNTISDYYPKLRQNKTVKLVLDFCKPDWIFWKVEKELDQVDRQVDIIKKEMDKITPLKYTVIEHKPDDSIAQELLGGAIEIKSNFLKN